jgi:hypothetical protein
MSWVCQTRFCVLTRRLPHWRQVNFITHFISHLTFASRTFVVTNRLCVVHPGLQRHRETISVLRLRLGGCSDSLTTLITYLWVWAVVAGVMECLLSTNARPIPDLGGALTRRSTGTLNYCNICSRSAHISWTTFLLEFSHPRNT